MEIEELKIYLRVDGDDEDLLLQSLISAAKNYLSNAGIKENGTNELYNLAVKLLVSHWFENREVVKVGTTVTEVPYCIKPIILQLQMVV